MTHDTDYDGGWDVECDGMEDAPSTKLAPPNSGLDMLDFFTGSKKPRPVQIEALNRIQHAFEVEKKRYFVLDAPTGSGKSEIGIPVGRFYGSAFLTTQQKLLMDQYESAFPELEMVKGMNNYRCSAFTFPDDIPELERTCDTADYLNHERHRKTCCDYIPVRNGYWRGPLSLTNVDFAFWAHMPFQLPGGMDYRHVLIIDECHNLEEKLLDFGKVEITHRHLQKIGMPAAAFLQRGSSKATVQQFIENYLDHVSRALANLASQPVLTSSDSKEQRRLNRQTAALELTLQEGDWIYWLDNPQPKKQILWHGKAKQPARDSLVLKPMNCKVAAAKLFSRAEKILFMSATVGKVDQFLAGLNIPVSEASWHVADSDFPVQNRLVTLYNVGKMGLYHKERTLPDIIEACSQIMDQLPDVKGLILVPSYGLQQELAARLGPRIITHTKDNGTEMISLHCESPEPTVLIGVYMHEGLDLKDDLARFLILPKVLYKSLKDPYVEERIKRDGDWYPRQTILAMVQAAGRVVRSATDRADICILDSCFADLLKHEDMFPRWFLEAVRVDGKKPPQKVTAAPAAEKEGS
jgi:Rad3-related DNA helicase